MARCGGQRPFRIWTVHRRHERQLPLQAAASNWQHSAEDSLHYQHGLRLRRPPQDRQRHQESDGVLWASCRSSAPPGGSATGTASYHILFCECNAICDQPPEILTLVLGATVTVFASET